MALSEVVAEYGVGLKFATDPKAIANLQKTLNDMEKRVERTFSKLQKQNLFGSALFGLDTAKLSNDIQRSLDRATSRTLFTIKNFRVDDNALEAAIQRAALRSRTVNVNPRVTGGGGTGNRSNAAQNGLISGSSRSPGVMWHSALAGGGVLSGFGLRALNTTMRELQSLPVAMGAVTGNRERTAAELAYLNTLGNEVGSPVRTLAPEYTKFLASAMGTPLEGEAQKSFRSVMRYSKVIGMDDQAVKGTLKALTQIANKQKIYSEELVGQLGERAPAAIRMMADAMTGGDTKLLFQLMEKGQLDPNVALPRFAAEMEKRAVVGWQDLLGTQGYQQDLAAKRFEDLLKVFAANGGESGFLRLWKSIADMLPQLTTLTKGLAGAFDNLSKGIESTTGILVMFDDWMENFSELSPAVQDSLQTMALAFIAFGTSAGRALLPFTMLFAFLDELAAYNRGGRTVLFGQKTQDYAGVMADPNQNRPVGGLQQALGFNFRDMKTVTPASLALGGIESLSGYIGRKIADFGESPIQLTPEASLDSMIKQMAWGSLDAFSADLSPKMQLPSQRPNYVINVQAKTNDPEEHGMLIMRTMQNMSTGE